MKKLFILLICLLRLALVVAPGLADLSVHFLDVGQGDATLILCDGEAMLIDGGPPSASQLVFTYLRNHTDQLEVMVATHPHEDHIGGLSAALNAVPVAVLFSPVDDWQSGTFRSIARYADEQGCPIRVPNEGDTFMLGGATVTILHCWPDAWSENDMSICLRIDYGNTSFLFTGDAEAISEYMMIDSGLPLHADILKVAHHGSRYSSTQEFIDAVNPRCAVISCGEGNSYGHPHEETLERLAGIEILRTDQLGIIIMNSDGDSITLGEQLSAQNAQARYIGNRKSMKFHYPNCEAVAKTSPTNQVPIATREDAIAMGYTPCGMCKP